MKKVKNINNVKVIELDNLDLCKYLKIDSQSYYNKFFFNFFHKIAKLSQFYFIFLNCLHNQ